MTSNIGSHKIMETLQSEETENKTKETNVQQQLESDIKQELQNYFRPEFLNRLDDIVIFNPISKTMLMSIIDIQLQQLIEHIAKEKNIQLTIDGSVRDFLADK